MTIKTAYEHPPGPCSPYGQGMTKAEAIADLERQIAEAGWAGPPPDDPKPTGCVIPWIILCAMIGGTLLPVVTLAVIAWIYP